MTIEHSGALFQVWSHIASKVMCNYFKSGLNVILGRKNVAAMETECQPRQSETYAYVASFQSSLLASALASAEAVRGLVAANATTSSALLVTDAKW